MILVLWILLIILPCIWGAGVLTIVYRKKQKCPFGFVDSYLLGLVAGIGMAEAVHAVGLVMDMSLSKVGRLFALLVSVVTVVCAVISAYGYFKDKSRYRQPAVKEKVKPAVLITFLVLVGVQAIFIYCMKVPVTSGDITLETVQSFLTEDGIYRVLPLTGVASEQGMPLRYTILCLPTLYAMLSQGFGIEPELLVCHIIPVVVLAAAYLAYYRLSETLFKREFQEKCFLFLLLVAILLTVSDGAIFLDGYSALHSGFTGVAIRNLVLVPYTICAALERRWWKAGLCILAEACITWTFMGCGVCLVITLGILLLIILYSLWASIALTGIIKGLFGSSEKKEEQT